MSEETKARAIAWKILSDLGDRRGIPRWIYDRSEEGAQLCADGVEAIIAEHFDPLLVAARTLLAAWKADGAGHALRCSPAMVAAIDGLEAALAAPQVSGSTFAGDVHAIGRTEGIERAARECEAERDEWERDPEKVPGKPLYLALMSHLAARIRSLKG